MQTGLAFRGFPPAAPSRVSKARGPLLLTGQVVYRTRMGSEQSIPRPRPAPQAATAQAEAPDHLDEAGSLEHLEDFRSDRSHDTDYVVIGSGIGGG